MALSALVTWLVNNNVIIIVHKAIQLVKCTFANAIEGNECPYCAVEVASIHDCWMLEKNQAIWNGHETKKMLNWAMHFQEQSTQHVDYPRHNVS